MVLLVGIILGAVLIWGRSRNPLRGTDAEIPRTNAADLASLTNSLPKQGGPVGYVGSAECKECHAKQYESWWRSHHRQMTQAMNTNTVQAQFEGVVMESGGARFTLHQSENLFWVDIQGIAELKAAQLTNGPPPIPNRIPMEMVTGSHHFQVFWIPTGHGNRQVGFPFTWLVAEKRWCLRNDHFIRDPDTEPRPEQWNLICIRCHTTGARPMPITEKKIFDTHVTELGIACEACHGPGQTHVASERKHKREGTESNSSPGDIIQPAHLDHVRSSQVCGFCHSMKWFEETPSWKQNGFTYRPGDDLEKTTPIIRPGKLAEEPWLKDVLAKHPDILKDFFWPDGMIRVTGREFNGLIESACYQKGELACVSCHSMHKSDPDKQVKEGMSGNQACLACHPQYEKNLAEHTHHAADSSGSLCYNCHMSYTSYGLLRGIRSHQITSPTVVSALKSGRPTACNQCHLDKTLKWASEQLSNWYKQPMPELSEEDGKVSAMVKLLLSGDTGQRALAAFSFGWEPALAASGKDWEAALLPGLLTDRYAALRFIAHRSLTHLPGFAEFSYDFESTPEQQADSATKAFGIWCSKAVRLPKRDETLTGPGPTIETNLVTHFLEHRDNRPVHLRE
ncbi:MAG TPA: multiheme c-type cytochrome [Candidatus Limnocylindrales bacterium]|nr:multiheme c-type cytochrome [Candidatus Limnocylindrales bacterium]